MMGAEPKEPFKGERGSAGRSADLRHPVYTTGCDGCADCLDAADRRQPEGLVGAYTVRTYAGREGDVDAAYSTLKEAVAAFHAAPVNSTPRLIHAGKTLAERDRKLSPIFHDAEAQRIHRELFGGYVLRTYAGFGKGDIDTPHPSLEAALAAFAVAPVTSIPRVIRDGRTIAELDPEAGLAPIFGGAEERRVYWIVLAGAPTEPTDPAPAPRDASS